MNTMDAWSPGLIKFSTLGHSICTYSMVGSLDQRRHFLVNQTLEWNRFYYDKSSNLRPVRSHFVAPKKSPQCPSAARGVYRCAWAWGTGAFWPSLRTGTSSGSPRPSSSTRQSSWSAATSSGQTIMLSFTLWCPKACSLIFSRDVDCGSGSAFIFPSGSGSRREKTKNYNRKNTGKLVIIEIFIKITFGPAPWFLTFFY